MSIDKKKQTDIPRIDFETVRETLEYIRADFAQYRDLEHVSSALTEAISQVEIARTRQILPNLKILRTIGFKNRYY